MRNKKIENELFYQLKQKNMKKNVVAYLPFLTAVALGMTSCSEDTAMKDVLSQKWQQALNGQADGKQNWVTAIDMQLNIIDNNGSTVSAYTIGDETPVLLGQKEMKGNGVLRLDIPQGIGNSIGLVSDNKNGRQYQRIYLGKSNKQQEDVDFTKGTNSSTVLVESQAQARAASAQTRVVANVADTPKPNQNETHNAALDGHSVAPIHGYSSFGGWAWENLLTALPESRAAASYNPDGVSYEFTSDGYQGLGVYGDNTIISLSYLYGYTGNTESRIIGYYTHSEGTYEDLELHDLGETILADYLASPGTSNYQAKVQYQLDGENKWYDANFYYTDGEGILSNENGRKVSANGSPERNGDGIFNTYLVYNNYGERISAMRGLTYQVSIPKGLKYGFYLRCIGNSLTEQHKQALAAKGVDVNKLGNDGINFSNQELNAANANNRDFYRSSYRKYDNFSFIGLDDSYTGGDLDCNDVTFGFLDADGKPGPHVYNEAEELQSWTIGYENQGMDADFDFNDVVIKVTPNPVTHKAKVQLLAAGGIYKTELYFGSQKLCEVHEAFGQQVGVEGVYSMVNTIGEKSNRSPIDLGEVDWPSDYTMSANGALFNTKVTLTDGKQYTASPGTYIGENNDVPTAVCVAGDWEWPKEQTNIFEAYPLIGEWGKNVNSSDYWNWYTQPKSGNVVIK